MGQWANYFLSTAGGAAALTGLIFVSVSLNLKRILSINHLPARALGSLVLLANILIVSSLCLIPGQSLAVLGIEVSLFGVTIWIVLTRMDIVMYKTTIQEYKIHYIRNLVYSQLAAVPYLVAGGCLLGKSAAGFYWLVAGITFSFIKSLTDAWVLLVEINR
ncbi:MAG: hypothetical protein P4L51_01210 [Puia sp.]|nr:hypothetical protein [Puia sp.]